MRKRTKDQLLTLVVEKPKKWAIERFLDRSDRRYEDAIQRHLFGGAYPRTMHLTIIGATGLPLFKQKEGDVTEVDFNGDVETDQRWPSSYAEVSEPE